MNKFDISGIHNRLRSFKKLKSSIESQHRVNIECGVCDSAVLLILEHDLFVPDTVCILILMKQPIGHRVGKKLHLEGTLQAVFTPVADTGGHLSRAHPIGLE